MMAEMSGQLFPPLSDAPGSGYALHPDGMRGRDGAIWRITTSHYGCAYAVTRDGVPIPLPALTLDEAFGNIRVHALGMSE